MGLSFEEKKKKIDTKLEELNGTIEKESKNRGDFKDKLDKKFRKEEEKYLYILEETIIDTHYNNKLTEYENKFENKRNKYLKEEKGKVERTLNMKYKEYLKKDDVSSFNNAYNELKKTLLSNFENNLKNKTVYVLSIKEELEEFIDNWITEKIEKFKVDKDKEISDKKSEIYNFIQSKYSEICDLATDEDSFKQEYEDKIKLDHKVGNCYNKSIYKNHYDSLIQDKLKSFRLHLKSKRTNIENKILSFFLKNFNPISEISSSKEEFKSNFFNELKKDNDIYPSYEDNKKFYEDTLESRVKTFEKILSERVENNKTNVKNKLLVFFNTNYNEISAKSSSEKEFKDNFRNKLLKTPDISDYYNKYYTIYTNLLEIHIKNFNDSLKERDKNEDTQIKNEFLNFFNSNYNQICEMSSNEKEFKINFQNKLNTINNLKNNYNKYLSYYNELMTFNCGLFKKYIEKKNEKDMINKENQILQFFNENFDEVSESSATEEEFEQNFEKKKKLNNKLLKDLEQNKLYYYSVLEENKSKFKNYLKNKFENLFHQKYGDAIDLSTNENEFKINLKNLLLQKEGIKELLNQKEYIDLYERLINENLIKIRKDIISKETSKKNEEINQINEFIDSNYDEIYKYSINKNEFIENMKKKASNRFKNISYFNTYLSKRAKDFEKEKKEEVEENMKIEKTNEYIQLEKELKKEYLEKIKNLQFTNQESINHFQDFDSQIAKDVCELLCNEEKYIVEINEKIDSYIKELLNEDKRKVKHLNILLCGNSGAGKSTLINSILELEGDKMARMGTGTAITMETKYYNSKKVPFLRCADSRGTEIRKNGIESYGISEVMEEMNKFINTQLESDNPDNFVHCIWYCILTLDSRFTEVIDECLKELESNYKLNGLPVIIVGTKSVSKQFNETFAKYLKDKKYKYEFIPVLAMKVDDHEPFGLEQLELKSIQLAMGGIESSCYQGTIKNITKASNLKIEEQKQLISESIDKKKEEIFKKIESNPQFDIVKIEMKNIFAHILEQYVSINLSSKINNNKPRKELSKKSKEEIDKLINQFYEHCKKLYDVEYSKFFESKVNEFLSDMSERKEEFFESTKIFIETKTKSQMKKEIERNIKDELKKKSDIYYLKNLFSEFTDLLIKSFPEYFIFFYNRLIENKEKEEGIKNLIITKIKKQFEDLKKEIEEYTKKKEKQKEKQKPKVVVNNGADDLLNKFLNNKK